MNPLYDGGRRKSSLTRFVRQVDFRRLCFLLMLKKVARSCLSSLPSSHQHNVDFFNIFFCISTINKSEIVRLDDKVTVILKLTLFFILKYLKKKI